jgi:phage terminase large subunit
MRIDATEVFHKNWEKYNDSNIRFIVNQGGSRSSKTYSIIQMIIVLCLQNSDLKVSVVRETFPALRSSVLRDFIEILKSLDLYDQSKHSKTEHIYTFSNNSSVEFFSTDSDQKIRGRKRDILYLNEGNEIPFDVYNQLVMRTSGKVFIDFNPSDADHYLYEVIERKDAVLIKSTYKDNVFLSQDQKEYIENLVNVDENYYRIYALGERPISTTRIYSHFQQYDIEPHSYEDISYGLDFGFSHPTALVQVKYVQNRVYVKELLYQSGLTSQEMISKFEQMGIDRSVSMYADSARPEIIEELRRRGFNKTTGANKNVKPGIDRIKSLEVFIHKDSINLWKEYRNYSWKMIKENITEEPIKLNDDALDAMRYAIYSHMKSVKGIPFFIG